MEAIALVAISSMVPFILASCVMENSPRKPQSARRTANAAVNFIPTFRFLNQFMVWFPLLVSCRSAGEYLPVLNFCQPKRGNFMVRAGLLLLRQEGQCI